MAHNCGCCGGWGRRLLTPFWGGVAAPRSGTEPRPPWQASACWDLRVRRQHGVATCQGLLGTWHCQRRLGQLPNGATWIQGLGQRGGTLAQDVPGGWLRCSSHTGLVQEQRHAAQLAAALSLGQVDVLDGAAQLLHTAARHRRNVPVVHTAPDKSGCRRCRRCCQHRLLCAGQVAGAGQGRPGGRRKAGAGAPSAPWQGSLWYRQTLALRRRLLSVAVDRC